MATELVILVSFVVMIMAAVFDSLPTSFTDAAPKLSARLEKQIETGAGFVAKDPNTNWLAPEGGN